MEHWIISSLMLLAAAQQADVSSNRPRVPITFTKNGRPFGGPTELVFSDYEGRVLAKSKISHGAFAVPAEVGSAPGCVGFKVGKRFRRFLNVNAVKFERPWTVDIDTPL